MATTSSDDQSTSNPDNSSGLENSSSSIDDRPSSSSGTSLSPSSNTSSSKTSSASSSSGVSSNSSNSSASSNSSTSSVHQDVYYTVTFLNYNDALLQEVQVKEGEDAVYTGEEPKRVEEDGYIYTFDSWDQPLTNITSNLTTRATYSKVADSGWSPLTWL